MFHNITDRVQLVRLFQQELKSERQILAAIYKDAFEEDGNTLKAKSLINIQRQIFVIVGMSCSFYMAHARLIAGLPNGTTEMMFELSFRELSSCHSDTTKIVEALNNLDIFANSMLNNATARAG